MGGRIPIEPSHPQQMSMKRSANALPWPRKTIRAFRGLICDIDGTLTTAGRVSAAAYAAMERAQAAGLLVVPVTGRPAGWCDLIARLWPVDAVIGENGAFYFRLDAAARRMIRSYAHDEAARARDARRLRTLAARVLRQVPGAAPAADQRYRETDLAIDYCEDVAPLAEADVQRIVHALQAQGLATKVSSIHVNGWFGVYDKLAAARRLMREQFAIELDEARERFLFVGDSPNDEPMFRYFPYAAAVANIERFLPALESRPGYVTRRAEGAGFVELVRALLAVRREAH
jgi:hypothetical protein